MITIHFGNYTKFPTDTDPGLEIPKIDLKSYEIILHDNLQALLRLSDNRFIICIENYNFTPLILDLMQLYLENGEIWLCWDLPKTHNLHMGFFFKNIKILNTLVISTKIENLIFLIYIISFLGYFFFIS